MEKNKQWLALCCSEIEAFLGWGDAARWRNDDFETLSEKIFERTGIRLSLSTMKRIWGRVRYDNFPGNATLNALVQLINYKDWREFCTQHPIETQNPLSSPLPQQSYQLKQTGKKYGWILMSGIVITSAIVLLAATHFKDGLKTASKNYNYKFSSRKTSDDLPNSVVFTYDAGVDKGNKVMIQQSWDSSRREMVDPIGHQHTSIYYYPGYFRARLMVNDSIVKQIPVFIKTKGWKVIAERDPLPVYFNDLAIRKNNGIEIGPEQFAQAIGNDFNNHWLQFSNIREFPGIDGNNFRFQAALRNTAAVEQSLCRKIRISILGTVAPVIITLSDRGCIADLYLYTGDSLISGKNNDLSLLGCDFSKPRDIAVEISKQRIKFYLDGKDSLSFPVTKSPGNIVGVRIFFEGSGELTNAKLSTPGTASYDLIKDP